MSVSFKNSLSAKLFAPLLLIFGTLIVALILYVPALTKENAINAAIPSAVSMVKQYKVIRGYYTKNVVKKVLAGSDLKPDFNHQGVDGAIPLPATFIHDLSKEFSSQGIMELKLYSAFPFPNRSSRQLDSFGQDAWKTLSRDPSQTFTRTAEVDGRQVVRVAVADTMDAQGCVNCHNSHPDTPKNDWQLNDVRGILEIQIPIDGLIAAGSDLNIKIIAMVVSALLITVLMLMVLFRGLISKRLAEVSNALEDIADGDGNLSQRLSSSDDEVGAIAKAFNKFASQLENSLKHIGTEVGQLVHTAQELQTFVEQSRQGAIRQQQETDQAAVAMNEMSATSQEVANIAASTAANTETTEQETETGRQVVSENMLSVEKLSQKIIEASEVVSNLESDSQNIGSVLDVIRSIAEQTNLLALNAAIEAARAGEQGRGFAVVADEVRTLAGRTQASTEEIQQMIEQLQQRAKVAVSTITQGNESLQNSLEQANHTNEAITNIAGSIVNIRDLNMQIATAAEEQAAVSDDMNRNIHNIAEVAKESSTASEHLQSSAKEINQAVTSINKQLQHYIGNS